MSIYVHVLCAWCRCQIQYHPDNAQGLGMVDGENTERTNVLPRSHQTQLRNMAEDTWKDYLHHLYLHHNVRKFESMKGARSIAALMACASRMCGYWNLRVSFISTRFGKPQIAFICRNRLICLIYIAA